MLVTPANRWNFIRLMLNNIRWGLMDAKYAGEEALRASGIEYTVVSEHHIPCIILNTRR